MASSRAEASALVSARRVLVNGAVAEKVARQVGPAEPVLVSGPPARFASRGGEKLEAALSFFEIPVAGRDALDAGASTGGFTDCLLQRCAASVLAVDVGHGQLLPRLRQDPRVEAMERVNVRQLRPAGLGGRRFDVVVADLSFISLTAVAEALCALAGAGSDLVVLVKPQFEAGRKVVSKGKGVVRDAEVRAEALERVAAAFAAQGARLVGAMPSPVLGPAGNVEFCLHFRPGLPPAAVPDGVLGPVAIEGARWR